MQSTRKGSPLILNIITIILAVLLATFLLLFGLANLINPDVADSYLGQNTRVCIMLILTGLVSIYAIFRPFSGGIILCCCGLIFFVIVIINPVAIPAVVLGILSIIRGRLHKKKILGGADQSMDRG